MASSDAATRYRWEAIPATRQKGTDHGTRRSAPRHRGHQRRTAEPDFYTNTLGLRLVKKTVNQDDVSAYHLFYGDEVGSPGTEVTFFDWAGMGPNLPGTGSIVEIGLRVPDRARSIGGPAFR